MDNTIYNQIKSSLEKIRDERGMYANTATRIGNAFLSLLSYVRNAVDTDVLPFLHKDCPDSTPFPLGVKRLNATEAVEVGDFHAGLLDGHGAAMWVASNGKSHIQVDIIEARDKAVFNELEVNKMRYSGGDTIYSRAGNNIVAVAPLYTDGSTKADPLRLLLDASGNFIVDSEGWLTISNLGDELKQIGWRCYFRESDDTTEVDNRWAVGDQGMCRATDLREAGSGANFGTRSYNRLVINTGSETLADGKLYNYIDLTNQKHVTLLDSQGRVYNGTSGYDDSLPNDEPMAGDSIVQMGNRFEADRQYIYAIYVSEGRRVDYDGVDDFNLDSHIVNDISPREWKVNADRFKFASKGKEQTLTSVTADIAQIQMDAKEIALKVEHDNEGADNLLVDSAFNRELSYGDRSSSDAEIIDGRTSEYSHNGRNAVRLSEGGYLAWYDEEVQEYETYTFSCYIRSTEEEFDPTKYSLLIEFYNTDGSTLLVEEHPLIDDYTLHELTEYRRISVTFTTRGNTAVADLVIRAESDAHDLFISEPMLSVGDTLYPWSEGNADAKATQKQMAALSVKADGISAKVEEIDKDYVKSADLDIKAGEISAEVKGEYSSAGMEITEDGIKYSGAQFLFCNPDGTPFIKVQQDALGIPHFRFLDTDGVTELYDLGYTGLRSLIGDATEYKYTAEKFRTIKIETGDVVKIMPSAAYESLDTSYKENATYYLFSAAKTIVNGKTIYVSDEAGKYDGEYFNSRENILDSDKTTYNPTSNNTLVQSACYISNVLQTNGDTKRYSIGIISNGIRNTLGELFITKTKEGAAYVYYVTYTGATADGTKIENKMVTGGGNISLSTKIDTIHTGPITKY